MYFYIPCVPIVCENIRYVMSYDKQGQVTNKSLPHKIGVQVVTEVKLNFIIL